MQPALSIYVQYLSQYLACYEKGSKVEDMQIHRVWANASRVYDLRWIQFHGDLHKALGKHREEHVNPLLKLGRRDWQLNSQARETENNMNNLGQQSQFLEILTKRELGWEDQMACPSQHQVFCASQNQHPLFTNPGPPHFVVQGSCSQHISGGCISRVMPISQRLGLSFHSSYR